MTRGRPQDGGLPLLRPKGQATPCHQCPKIPADAQERTSRFAQDPTERSWRAYGHYLECAAVMHFPDDALVRRNAAVIRRIEKAKDRLPLLQLVAVLGGKIEG